MSNTRFSGEPFPSGTLVLKFSTNGGRLLVSRYSNNIESVSILDVKSGVNLSSPEGLGTSGVVARHVFSPDGKLLARSYDNLLRVGNVLTGKLMHTYRGQTNPVVAFGFTPDGSRLWSVEQSGLLKEWDLSPTGPLTRPFSGGANGSLYRPNFAVSPDGARVAMLAGRDGSSPFTLTILDQACNPVRTLHPPPGVWPTTTVSLTPFDTALSVGGRRAALVRQTREFGMELLVWDVDTGKVIFHLPAVVTDDSPFGPTVAFSADGTRLAVSWAIGTQDGRSGPPQLWEYQVGDGHMGKQLSVPAAAIQLSELKYSPTGDRLAGVVVEQGRDTAVVSSKVVVWDVGGHAPTSEYELFSAAKDPTSQIAPTVLAWSADGSRLAVSHRVADESVLAVLDARTGRRTAELGQQPNQPTSGFLTPTRTGVVFSPDGKRVAAVESEGFRTRVKV